MTRSLPSPKITKAALIVFGKDEAGKGHASSFLPAEARAARKAAALMGMAAFAVSSDAEQTAADSIPVGRVFVSGRAFVPFVKATVFDQIATLHTQAVAEGRDQPADDQSSDASIEGQPTDWPSVTVGSMVLAASPPNFLYWYQCLVTGDNGDGLLTLQYCDWPEEEQFERRREAVALMHSTYKPRPMEPDGSAEAA